MANQAERIPVEDQYLRALGRAAYNFAYLEWGIVWLIECINVGFLNEVRNLTAGQIAARFEQAVGKLGDNDHDKVALQLLALSFSELVGDRNRLMHGNPFTAAGGEQRLLYDGKHGRKDWTTQLIEGFSNETATASIEASRLLHSGLLARYKTNQGTQMTFKPGRRWPRGGYWGNGEGRASSSAIWRAVPVAEVGGPWLARLARRRPSLLPAVNQPSEICRVTRRTE